LTDHRNERRHRLEELAQLPDTPKRNTARSNHWPTLSSGRVQLERLAAGKLNREGKAHEVPCRIDQHEGRVAVPRGGVPAHELRAAGTITDVWVKADFSGAVLVLDCADAAEATAALNTLPIAINDAATVVLTEILDADAVRPSGGAAAADNSARS
jgi:hypothetical protein